MTCGDDAQTKMLVAKAQGFWGDVDSYYESPPRLLSIDRLDGEIQDTTKLLQILLTASYALALHHLQPFADPATGTTRTALSSLLRTPISPITLSRRPSNQSTRRSRSHISERRCRSRSSNRGTRRTPFVTSAAGASSVLDEFDQISTRGRMRGMRDGVGGGR